MHQQIFAKLCVCAHFLLHGAIFYIDMSETFCNLGTSGLSCAAFCTQADSLENLTYNLSWQPQHHSYSCITSDVPCKTCHVTCQSALQQSPRDKGQDFGPTLWPLLLRNQTSSVCSTPCGGSPTFQQGSQSPVCNSILFVMTSNFSPRRRQSKTRRVLEQPERAGRQWLVLSHTAIQSNGGQSASLALFCDENFAELGPGRPPAGLDGIVVRIQLHTPRFAPAALSSVEVSGNRGNDKTP